MPKEEDINKFTELMVMAIEEHQSTYGETWKEMAPGHLEARLKQKMAEYELTLNPSKLVSIANLAMLLHLRMKEFKDG